jgi:RNA polymerase sigma-70 factor (ECF subfamily)
VTDSYPPTSKKDEPFRPEPDTTGEQPVEPNRAALRLVASGNPPGAGRVASVEPIAVGSLDLLYRSYSSYVAAIALRLLGRDEDVDDVVQDVFLSAWKGIRQLRDAAAVKGWLATVTVRIARRKLRMRKVKVFLRFEDEPQYENIPAPGATADQHVLLKRVYSILETLPVNERLAWTLRYVEREQLDDVARLCDCSLATAKRRISAAQAAIDAVVSDDADAKGAASGEEPS